MGAEAKAVKAARDRLAREFPEMKGAPAKVVDQGGPGDKASYLITFHGRVALPGGKSLERVVRAVVDERGRILKWSTSR